MNKVHFFVPLVNTAHRVVAGLRLCDQLDVKNTYNSQLAVSY